MLASCRGCEYSQYPHANDMFWPTDEDPESVR
jgi:hypothetical protein